MATTNLYLLRPNKKGESLILLYLRLGLKKQMVFSTNEFIFPKDWDLKNKCAKRSMNGYEELNQLLEAFKSSVLKIYRKHKVKEAQLDIKELKTIIQCELKGINLIEPAKIKLIHFAQYFALHSRGIKKQATILSYNSSIVKLKEFQTHVKRDIDFKDINLDFYNEFVSFLTIEKGLAHNTIGKHVKTLKVFLTEATERGINENMYFKNKRFKVLTEPTSAIYLNSNELQRIDRLDLGNNKRLEAVKNIFLVGCFTGLRFSDYRQFKQENIYNNILTIRTTKTDHVVSIPLHPTVQSILKNYTTNGVTIFPRIPTNQKMNEYLKEIGLLAEITEKVNKVITVGGIKKEQLFKKFELISTHTARRSFSTNLYLQGFPAISIMKITGHKTEKSFLGYIKVSQETNALKLQDFWQKLSSNE